MIKLLSSTMLSLLMLTQFMGCKKSSVNTPEKSTWSFTYNGQTYSKVDTFFNLDGYTHFSGIEIRSHNGLGGVMRFTWGVNTCASFVPTGMDVSFNYNTCAFGSNSPIDSSKIYTYQSGTKDFTISNCREKSFPVLGSLTVCTIAGSFSVVLVNNVGQTKTISGTFRFVDQNPI